MRSTWKGCTRMRRWNASLPACFTMYLLAAMRAASRASDVICSFSQLHSRGTCQLVGHPCLDQLSLLKNAGGLGPMRAAASASCMICALFQQHGSAEACIKRAYSSPRMEPLFAAHSAPCSCPPRSAQVPLLAATYCSLTAQSGCALVPQSCLPDAHCGRAAAPMSCAASPSWCLALHVTDCRCISPDHVDAVGVLVHRRALHAHVIDPARQLQRQLSSLRQASLRRQELWHT